MRSPNNAIARTHAVRVKAADAPNDVVQLLWAIVQYDADNAYQHIIEDGAIESYRFVEEVAASAT